MYSNPQLLWTRVKSFKVLQHHIMKTCIKVDNQCVIVCAHSNHQEKTLRVIRNRFRIRKPFIKVSTDAVVSYGNNTIRVFRGSVQLHKFPKIRWLQVFNQTKRVLTLSGNATEELFPGFGRLHTVQYYICGYSWSAHYVCHMNTGLFDLKQLGV